MVVKLYTVLHPLISCHYVAFYLCIIFNELPPLLLLRAEPIPDDHNARLP